MMCAARRVSLSLCAGAVALCSSPVAAQPFEAELVASGLARPVAVVPPPDGSGRVFIVEQRTGSGNTAVGHIRVMDAAGTVLPADFISIDVRGASEQGLLGLTFHPDFATNRRLFVNYSQRNTGDTVVAEILADSTDPNVAQVGSLNTIMLIDQPDTNHNGGWIEFGPDGYLYIACGDGGSGNDPWGALGNGQNLSTKLGSMLRVDVDGDDFPGDANNDYAVPADNPFVGIAGADEAIWAYGLRNPWRNDFDPQTGDLYIADVGQFNREEVNHQPASSAGGENYGWRKWEGTRLNFAGDPGPDAVDTTFPVDEYTHGSPEFGCSITGGVVCRTQTLPDLWGEFIFADFCSDRVYALRNTASGWVRENITADIVPDAGSVSGIGGFGRDAQGRVYVCSLFSGTIHRITQPGICGLADINESGNLNLDDVDALVAAFIASGADADLDQNGLWNVDDIDLFVASFLAGCP
ncbi:MAG: hypothetical protein DHS20C14_04100 [Phycisphaeraceae bacterium]|nr:MAG: hypothetical protein DHS20C14_04100 [Phycisphaeraceae bacterium]